jgi:hypothetical protein
MNELQAKVIEAATNLVSCWIPENEVCLQEAVQNLKEGNKTALNQKEK